jgi:glycosyltransferase involved in cell wall biosynthesis
VTPLSVVVVGSSPWNDELTDDDLNLRVALTLADRLGGRYDVIVPSGTAGPERLDRDPVYLHRLAARTRLGFLVAAHRALNRVVMTQPQVLMSSDPFAALVIESSRARRSLPHIVHIQGEVLTPGGEYGGWLKRRALSTASRSAVRRASAVRVVSESLRDAVTPMTKSPVAFLGNRVDTRMFAPRPAGRLSGTVTGRMAPAEVVEADAVMVGSLIDVKNHATIVRAWSRIVREFPRARLLIVGDGPCRRQLTALADALALQSNVEVRGAVPHRQVADLLRTAGCLVHPSWSEGQPRAVLEGMACGLPVICSDIPAHREIVPATVGRLVAPGDVDGWAARITAILRDPAGAAEMGRHGRALAAERHDFTMSIDRCAEFVRAVTARHWTGESSS